MSLKTIIDTATEHATALLEYANEFTGQNSPDLGEAIRTLCDGFGSSGGSFEFIGESEPVIINLSKDTSWDSTVFTTANQTIRAQQNNAITANFSHAVDLNEYNIYVIFGMNCKYVYKSDIVPRSINTRQRMMSSVSLYNAMSSDSTFLSTRYNSQVNYNSKLYYTRDGKNWSNTNPSAGVFCTLTITTQIIGTESAVTGVRNHIPALVAKINNPMMSEESMDLVDSENTNVVFVYKCYKCPKEKDFIYNMMSESYLV